MANIVVYALSRSGSSYLHYVLAAAFPGHISLFEPRYLSVSDKDSDNVLAKVVLDAHNSDINLEDFSYFDRKIVLVRDARDRMISAFLFGLHGAEQGHYEKTLQWLRHKEQAPTALSFIDLVRQVYPHLSLEALGLYFRESLRLIMSQAVDSSDVIVVRYEDIMQQQFEKIEHFLATTLNYSVMLPDRHAYAKRATTIGQWKDWLTQEDVIFLQPIFAEFQQRFQYGDDWQLNGDQRIPSEHSSGFVEQARRKKHYFELQNIFWSDH